MREPIPRRPDHDATRLRRTVRASTGTAGVTLQVVCGGCCGSTRTVRWDDRPRGSRPAVATQWRAVCSACTGGTRRDPLSHNRSVPVGLGGI
jgi:hypothetical protein